MAEPAASSAVGAGLLGSLLIILLGPEGVEYAALFCAAVSGSLWPLSKAATPTRAAAAVLLLRWSATALCLSGLIVWEMRQHWGWTGPTQITSVGVAFIVAAIGDDWRGIFRAIATRARTLVSGTKPSGDKP